MDMPKPNEHHERLKRLVGSWQGTETMHPSQWDPKGGEATGKSVSTLALGGFAVITDYEQERGGTVTYAGHGVWTCDSKADQVVLYWFDSMGSPAEVFKGGWDGDHLTVAHGGPGMHARLSYDFSRDGRMASRMEMSSDGLEWKTLFDGSYRLK